MKIIRKGTTFGLIFWEKTHVRISIHVQRALVDS